MGTTAHSGRRHLLGGFEEFLEYQREGFTDGIQVTAGVQCIQQFGQGDLPMPPARRVAVVACMDARLRIYGMLGLREGDVHVTATLAGWSPTTSSVRC